MYILIDNNLPMSALLATYFYNYKIYFFLIIKENNIVDVIDLNNPLIYQKINSKTNHNNTSPKKVSLVLGQSIGTHCED
jgi:hypothetical protein